MRKELKENKSNLQQSLKQTGFVVAILSALGWIIAVPLVGFSMFGWWLDSILNTAPWLLIVGIILGTTSASLVLWRIYVKYKKIGNSK